MWPTRNRAWIKHLLLLRLRLPRLAALGELHVHALSVSSQTRARPLIEAANKISKKAQVRIARIVSGKNHQTKALHKTTSLACTYADVFTSNAERLTLSRIQVASNFVCASGSSKMSFAFESPGYQAHVVHERSPVSENESCPIQNLESNAKP